MINYDKAQECIKVLNFAKDEVFERNRKLMEGLNSLSSFGLELNRQVDSLDRELNINNKISILDSLSDFVNHYMSELMSWFFEFKDYVAILTDISQMKVKIPEYTDQRSWVVAAAENEMYEFSGAYFELLKSFQAFIEDPSRRNLEEVKNTLGNYFNVEELENSIGGISENMVSELDDMCNEINKIIKKNQNKR